MDNKESSKRINITGNFFDNLKPGTQLIDGVTCGKTFTSKQSGGKNQATVNVKSVEDADIEQKGGKNAKQITGNLESSKGKVKIVLDQKKDVQTSNATQPGSASQNTSSTATSSSNSANMDESEGQQKNNYGY